MNYYIYVYLDPRKCGKYKYKEFIFNNEPIYIGYGKYNRMYMHLIQAKQNKCYGNRLKFNKIKKILYENKEPIIIKLKDNLTINEARYFEKNLISEIGRIDLETGPLTNLTDGGEGLSNPSIETREKLARGQRGLKHSLQRIKKNKKWRIDNIEKFSGNNHWAHRLGIKKETKDKISKTLQGNIPWNKGKNLSKSTIKKISKKSKESIKLQKINKINGRFIKKIYQIYVNNLLQTEIIGSCNFYKFCRENEINRTIILNDKEYGKWLLKII